jgi:hypothetical protein
MTNRFAARAMTLEEALDFEFALTDSSCLIPVYLGLQDFAAC